ncbi:MAG: protein-tyrosine-phosphatase [Cyclobacteriaceae bacterium]
MIPTLEKYIQTLPEGISSISPERIDLLNEIADYILAKKKSNQTVKMVFICTHNSRRSHLSQIWAATLAHQFSISNIDTFSGGTEVTALNIRAVNALHRAGFNVISSGGDNPKYQVGFDQDAKPMLCYSKTYDAPENPKSDFAALMTCDHADENCPLVSGSDARFSLYYSDPKEADDTPWEAERYEERLKQIGTEIYYLMQTVKTKIDER